MKKNDQVQIIFGLKLRQLRNAKGFSLSDLSKKSGISLSYINEIEKGKKYPKSDKIMALAEALSIPYDQLVSLKVNKALAPAMQAINSELLSQFPLGLFGIEANKLIEMIAAAPAKVNSFITTLIEIARSYQLTSEQFYFRALRAYQELHMNYFEDLEMAVVSFVKQSGLNRVKLTQSSTLIQILEEKFHYTVISDESFKDKGLSDFRSLTIPGKRTLYYLNPTLKESQKCFQITRELGYCILALKDRPHTSTIVRVKTFEEALNNFKASYFANAILMPYDEIVADLNKWFALKNWNEDYLIKLIEKYKVSAETFLYRLCTVIPHEFGINNLFFLRFYNTKMKFSYELDKELHLGQMHSPHASGLGKHYCRRWAAIRSLAELTKQREKRRGIVTKPLIHVQRSKYLDTDFEYLLISIARPHQIDENLNSSISIGFLVNKDLLEKIKFAEDPAIIRSEVNHICETCSVSNCKDRAAKPYDLEESIRKKKQEETLNAFFKSLSKS
ncbi:MAG: helix-turn-helix domain-containing protein [Bacteroidia bacterium]